MRRWSLANAAVLTLLAFVAVRCAADDDAPLSLEDLKCEACDYAVRAWVRHAVLIETECHRRNGGGTADVQLASILPKNDAGDNLLDPARDCDGAHVANEGVDALAGALCKELFLDEFPYVEEFPADGSMETDREKMWLDPPSYWTADPKADGVEPMAPKDLAMVRKACETTLPLGHGARRAKAVATIRAAVRAGRFGELEQRIREQKKEQLTVVIDNAEEAAKLKMTSDELEDEATANAAIGAEVAKATTDFLLLEKRQAVYDVVLAMQRDMCTGACDADIQRPSFDRRVRGWSASLKRM
uniref:DUF3456 domain-containing protein n=1 Tax=Neobodo designis TaxID=312471 RepID=A0A7S1QUQ8_NEODS|mmetsp:Transcript_5253/g.16670  ORF Transcript_5253/g.16670 Transcript_5253/m.16670 type:complete len:301 (+) Transcript_5253:41-943(+)